MTPERQRVAIAEACGWREIEPCTCCDGVSRGCTPTPGAHKKHLPNYLNDLNAMHEAEKVLTVAQRITYANQIGVVLSGGSVGRAIPNWWFIHEATAAQRAEAFLRTIGKWEEAK